MEENELENLLNEDDIDKNEVIEYTDDSIKKYWEEISKYKLLNESEQKLLFIEYKNGNMNARNRLIESNLRLVVYIVKKYFNGNKNISLTFLDLVQEGNISLTRAVDTYDIEKNIRFSSYAALVIKRGIQRTIDSLGYHIRIPLNMRKTIRIIKKYQYEMYLLNGEYPTRKELIDHFGFDEEKLEELLFYAQNIISLNYPITEKTNNPLIDSIVDETANKTLNVEDEILYKKIMNYAKEVLTPREYQIFADRIVYEDRQKSLAELGEKFGITSEWVRKIEGKVLCKVRRKNYYER